MAGAKAAEPEPAFGPSPLTAELPLVGRKSKAKALGSAEYTTDAGFRGAVEKRLAQARTPIDLDAPLMTNASSQGRASDDPFARSMARLDKPADHAAAPDKSPTLTTRAETVATPAPTKTHQSSAASDRAAKRMDAKVGLASKAGASRMPTPNETGAPVALRLLNNSTTVSADELKEIRELTAEIDSHNARINELNTTGPFQDLEDREERWTRSRRIPAEAYLYDEDFPQHRGHPITAQSNDFSMNLPEIRAERRFLEEDQERLRDIAGPIIDDLRREVTSAKFNLSDVWMETHRSLALVDESGEHLEAKRLYDGARLDLEIAEARLEIFESLEAYFPEEDPTLLSVVVDLSIEGGLYFLTGGSANAVVRVLRRAVRAAPEVARRLGPFGAGLGGASLFGEDAEAVTPAIIDAIAIVEALIDARALPRALAERGAVSIVTTYKTGSAAERRVIEEAFRQTPGGHRGLEAMDRILVDSAPRSPRTATHAQLLDPIREVPSGRYVGRGFELPDGRVVNAHGSVYRRGNDGRYFREGMADYDEAVRYRVDTIDQDGLVLPPQSWDRLLGDAFERRVNAVGWDVDISRNTREYPVTLDDGPYNYRPDFVGDGVWVETKDVVNLRQTRQLKAFVEGHGQHDIGVARLMVSERTRRPNARMWDWLEENGVEIYRLRRTEDGGAVYYEPHRINTLDDW